MSNGEGKRKKEKGKRQAGGAAWLATAASLLFSFFLFPFSFADEPAPRFRLTTAAGPTHTGSLDKLTPDWSLRLLNGDTPLSVKGAEVVSLRRDGVLLPRTPAGPQLVFANGDRLPLHRDSMLLLSRERLYVRPDAPLKAFGQELAPPLATVALIWLAPPEGTDDPAVFLRRLLAAPRTRDVVLLRDGERLEGSVVDLDRDRNCRLQVGKRRVDVPLARVAAIAFNSNLLARLRPPGPYAHLVLNNGCRLGLVSARVQAGGKTLFGKTLFGGEVEVALDRVMALDVRQGAAVYLSDLQPRRYAYTPFLGVAWPYARDEGIRGRELGWGGGAYDKGLGMHAESRLTYALDAKYRSFEAVIGLDEHTGKRGRVRVQVLVDGRPRDIGWDKELTARDGPMSVRVDVRGGRELTLAVLFGRFGDVQADVNWADARLIKDR